MKSAEPKVDVTSEYYSGQLAQAFSYYNMNGDKKEARAYMRTYLKTYDKTGLATKQFDNVSDNAFVQTYGWLARIKTNGHVLRKDHEANFTQYLTKLLLTAPDKKEVVEVAVEVSKPTIQDHLREKTKEYLGELEGVLDDLIKNGKDFNLYNDLKSKNIPKQFGSDIIEWADKKSVEYSQAYQATDGDLKEGYSNLGKRKLSQIVKLLSEFVDDVNRYSEFKKANRKVRVKKAKPASQQVTKLKYLKEFPELKLTSISPTEIVGAAQVWIYNTKYKKLAVYRTESSSGIQVKGTTLQNYEPELCEQKTIRKPEVFLKQVMEASKVKLRKIMDDLTTKESTVNGRINEECIILRAIK